MDYRELAAELIENLFILNKTRPNKLVNESMQGESFVVQYIHRNKNSVLPGEISSRMGISSARIAAALNSLEKKGLVTRRIDTDDRRRILVDLTEKGRALAEEQRRMVLEDMTRLLSMLGEDDAREYVRITCRLAAFALKGKTKC